MAKITAIIDIGSNSARMALFEKSSRFAFHLIKEIKSRVRISEGTYENGSLLQPIPMQRAVIALKEFAIIAKNHGATKIICVATSAVRNAPNRHEFVHEVYKQTGISIKVIDGTEEANLGAISAINLLPIKNAITIDIGGGSTECALICDGKIVDLISLELGTIRLKELFYDKKSSIDEAKRYILNEFKRLPNSYKSDLVVGIGGTIRAISKTFMKNTLYPIDTVHGYEYETSEYLPIIEQISESSVLKLKRFNIKEERYDTIREGALIFSMLIKEFNSKSVITSGAGVREGRYLKDLLRNSNLKFPANFNPSVRVMIDKFIQNRTFNEYNSSVCGFLFDLLKAKHKLDDSFKRYLKISAMLSDIGSSLSFYNQHEHSKYFIINNLVYGFTHKERVLIATLIANHTKELPNTLNINPYTRLLPDIRVLRWLSFILGVSYYVNITNSNPKIEFKFSNDTLYIKSNEPMSLAKEQIKKLEKPEPMAIIFE
ncbi:MAG: Ppx/GppA family phosphatase [Campylobacterales bacterium]|nr:Ppx/GppA family phosphatase [Campylobacterales bacterium]